MDLGGGSSGYLGLGLRKGLIPIAPQQRLRPPRPPPPSPLPPPRQHPPSPCSQAAGHRQQAPEQAWRSRGHQRARRVGAGRRPSHGATRPWSSWFARAPSAASLRSASATRPSSASSRCASTTCPPRCSAAVCTASPGLVSHRRGRGAAGGSDRGSFPPCLCALVLEMEPTPPGDADGITALCSQIDASLGATAPPGATAPSPPLPAAPGTAPPTQGSAEVAMPLPMATPLGSSSMSSYGHTP